MTAQPDLAAFINARLDEDETAARGAWPEGIFGDWMRKGSARALREAAAKRAILAAHPVTTEVIPPGYRAGTGEKFGCETCHDWDGVTEGRGYCGTLRALAAVYADHPDYRDGAEALER